MQILYSVTTAVMLQLQMQILYSVTKAVMLLLQMQIFNSNTSNMMKTYARMTEPSPRMHFERYLNMLTLKFILFRLINLFQYTSKHLKN